MSLPNDVKKGLGVRVTAIVDWTFKEAEIVVLVPDKLMQFFLFTALCPPSQLYSSEERPEYL